jgi:hypothetical protein
MKKGTVYDIVYGTVYYREMRVWRGDFRDVKLILCKWSGSWNIRVLARLSLYRDIS